MIENEGAPGAAPAPAAPAPNDSPSAKAEAELRSIMAGTHEKSAAWRSSDKAAIEYAIGLRKVAAGEQPAPEAKPSEVVSETSTELTPAERAEIEAEKSMGYQELESQWGPRDSESFVKNGREVGEVVATLFDRADPFDEGVFKIFAGGAGNNPDAVDFLRTHVRPLLGNFLNSAPPSNLPPLTPEQETQFAEKAVRHFLFGAQPRVVRALIDAGGDDPGVIKWLSRWGQRLFTDTGAPKAMEINKGDAAAAERELSQFRDGTHAMAEKWKQRDPAARNYFESLLRRTTGGK